MAGMAETATDGQLRHASVLFSGIHNSSALSAQLHASEMAELFAQYHSQASQAIVEHGGAHLQFTGDGLVAVFTDTHESANPPGARQAIAAALALTLAAHECRSWLAQRFPARDLGPFAIGVGLHCGSITLYRLGVAHNSQVVPIGETVNIAVRLQAATRELGWSLAASKAVLTRAGNGIQTGAQTVLAIKGAKAVALMLEALEVTGLAISAGDKAHGMKIGTALTTNAEMSARLAQVALGSRLKSLKAPSFDLDAVPVRLNGYRIVRKIGSGGMTEVYLAERQSDGLSVVLKILHSSAKNAAEQLLPFIQEYALLSKISHPHVVRIHDQGFTDDHIYIAMEYFERGDLRQLFGREMTQKRVLGIIKEVASALDAIHKEGIIHRDIKPENIMQRADGSIALADFGIAQSMQPTQDTDFMPEYGSGAVGTPYYMSPEQASGQAATAQSDLYSLGVMMFEMLTGKRPFVADSLALLLEAHRHAQTPALPAAHAHLQGIAAKLMHKTPALRYASAQDLMADIDRLNPQA
ncbi:MAG: hypothetical protein EAZ34_08630 [Polaromonas sp.]|nr:MAG: hypothetical protein EAZ34_08630 [Polaromonas sp.]